MDRQTNTALAARRYAIAVWLFMAAIACACLSAGFKLSGQLDAADAFRGGAMVAGLGGALMAFRWLFTNGGQR